MRLPYFSELPFLCNLRIRDRVLSGFLVVTVLFASLQPCLHSQAGGGQSQPMDPISFGGPKDEPIKLAKKEMLRRIAVERQKQLAESSAQLVRLANDLNTAVHQQNGGWESAASEQKAVEIAKLAHSIRQKMAESSLR